MRERNERKKNKVQTVHNSIVGQVKKKIQKKGLITALCTMYMVAMQSKCFESDVNGLFILRIVPVGCTFVSVLKVEKNLLFTEKVFFVLFIWGKFLIEIVYEREMLVFRGDST